MATLERERIASRDWVTAVMETGFERMDAAHERLFQFQRENLTRDDAYRNRVLSQVVRFGWAGVVLVAVVLAVMGAAASTMGGGVPAPGPSRVPGPY